MLSNWVTGGGNLIAMRPDAQLASLLGLTAAGTTLTDAYLLVTRPRVPEPASSRRRSSSTAPPTATRSAARPSWRRSYSSPATSTVNPAVTLRSVGSNGGQAAAFAYDLARSVVHTRQGNPGLGRTGARRHAADPLRRSVLPASWIDFAKIAIPQADEQQRAARQPDPADGARPQAAAALLVLRRATSAPPSSVTGDDHGNGGTAGRFAEHIAQSPVGCSVADWECVRATSYIFPGTPIDDAEAQSFEDRGFEIARPPQYRMRRLDSRATSTTSSPSQLDALLGATPQHRTDRDAPRSLRHVERRGWRTATAEPTDTACGSTPTTTTGRRTGSRIAPACSPAPGMPMRFADTGRRDDRRLPGGHADDRRVRPDVPVQRSTPCSTAPPDRSATTACSPPTCIRIPEQSAGADAIVASAQTRGVPIVSARQMLTLARRPQRLGLRLDCVHRQPSRLHDRRRIRRHRPACHGAEDVGAGRRGEHASPRNGHSGHASRCRRSKACSTPSSTRLPGTYQVALSGSRRQ